MAQLPLAPVQPALQPPGRAVVASASASSRPILAPRQRRADHKGVKYDLVLSSGFLAFANHCGFLQAVDDVGLPVGGIMGTSAGALIGSLYAAGYAPREIVEVFANSAPIERLACSKRIWEGVLSMQPLIEELHTLLPASFADLQRDFAAGVVSASGQHVLLDRGSLPAAVTASAAIPVVFCPVEVPDREDGPFIDGGIKCRIGLDLWRQQRYGSDPAAAAPAVVHLIGRSSPFSGNDNTAGLNRQNAVVVKSPKSGGSFFSYGDYETQFEAARQRALPVLRQLLESDSGGGDQGGRSSSVAGAANGVVPSLGLTGSGAGSGLATTSS
ncbi:phospholipase [Micractinium conductrix]|uniref:Patatin n=1 Tax=Micractinium conductrix TaxID=554055 RepID=A0A2P6VK68_9CHLO|nr:phospholipase [Micractinium conductrix]|eukprot:PSC74468.1 phospholipase [Micractinium conductrix]